MLRLYVIPVLIMFLVSSSTVLRAQWIPAQGMDGAKMITLDINDTVLFISAQGQGITKKNVNAGSWREVLENDVAKDVFHAGPYEFCNPYARVYRSSDLGNTWIQPIQNFYGAWQLKNVDSVIFLTYFTSLMRSTDFGDTWTSLDDSFIQGSSKTIWANDSYLYCYSGTTASNSRLYFSTNKGNIWDTIPIAGMFPQYVTLREIFHFQGKHFLSRTEGVFVYDTLTSHWVSINDSLYFNDFISFQNELYGAGSGVYSFDQNSGTFVPRINGLPGGEFRKLSCTGSSLYCAANGGVFRTFDGNSWENLSGGLHGGNVFSLSRTGNEVWVLSDIGGFRSLDNGATFQQQNMPADPRKIIISPSGYYLMTNQSFYASGDQGATWVQSVTGIPPDKYCRDFSLGGGYLNLSIHPITDSNRIYSTPAGNISWTPVNASSYWRNPICLSSNDSATVYTIVSDENIPFPARITTDHFLTTDTVKEIQSGMYIYPRSEPDRIFIKRFYADFLQSENGYNSWRIIPFPDSVDLEDMSGNNYGIVASGGISHVSMKVFYTYDHGSNWTDITGNLYRIGSGTAYVVQVADNRLFCGTVANGLWYRDDVLTGTSKIPEKQFSLKISPNPAKSQAVLEFEEAKSSSAVRIIITDMMGRTISDRTIVSCSQPVCRETLDVHSLNPGLYNVRLICGKRCESSRLIISR